MTDGDEGGRDDETTPSDADDPASEPGADIDVEAPEHEEIARKAANEPDSFFSLMGHFYRGAQSRTLKWRDRLDKTVNWSVLVVASLLTWTFSSPDRPHSVLLLGVVVITVFLWIESRRYLFFDVWRSQVRILEENLFAHALEPTQVEEEGWRRRLSADMRRPAFKISILEALGRRLRRVYLALIGILLAAWLLRLITQSRTAADLVERAGIWTVPGWGVIAAVGGFYALLIGLALWPRERQAKGHVRDREHAVDLTKEP